MKNFVVIMTDTQNKSMVGAYGNPAVNTPNLDKLAAAGTRFDKAYTTCPLCTPARSAIFTGQHSQVNGAWCNNVAPGRHIPMMGEIFSFYGFDVAYTGKWHLDGSGYFGDGVAGGGFPQKWWYDGKCYLDEIGPELKDFYNNYSKTAEDLRENGFADENMIWGHNVADKAIEFLQEERDKPYVLVVSFDEPHGPFVCPPDYWDEFNPETIPMPDNFKADVSNKPELQQVQVRERVTPDWQEFIKSKYRFYGCNTYIDKEIGRVIDAVDKDNTVIIYTSDHGDMLGAHGLHSKGPMMYEEIINIPFIISGAGFKEQQVCNSLVSHLDIIPTMLDIAGIDRPASLPGISLQPLLENPDARVNDYVMIEFTRFAINHDGWNGMYPIRCLTDGRYKLVINLDDTDELYDLQNDRWEMNNLIECGEYAEVRDRLHDLILDEMDNIRDPFRSYRWGDRSWRKVGKASYYGGTRRNRPEGFPFEKACYEAK